MAKMQRNNDNSSATSNVQSACAACKHQRKKCGEDCRLARYFPADRNREFQAVNKVFGVSNMTKIVHCVNDEESRQKVVDSLIWEAYWRQHDPVSGPYGEYKRVCEELKVYRNRTLMQNHNQNSLLPLAGQGGMIYKSASQCQQLMRCNDENRISVSSNEQLSYNNYDNGNNSIVDMDNAYGNYALHFMQSPKNLTREREVDSVVIPQQQQQQQQQQQRQYYIPGQFS